MSSSRRRPERTSLRFTVSTGRLPRSRAISSFRSKASKTNSNRFSILDRQAAQLQATRSLQPGRLALSSSRARWLSQCQQQEATLQRIQSRLQMVRELRDGLGIGGTRMVDLARQRLAHEQPGLVAERDAAVRAERQSREERRSAAEDAHLRTTGTER